MSKEGNDCRDEFIRAMDDLQFRLLIGENDEEDYDEYDDEEDEENYE